MIQESAESMDFAELSHNIQKTIDVAREETMKQVDKARTEAAKQIDRAKKKPPDRWIKQRGGRKTD